MVTSHNSMQAPYPCRRSNTGLRSPARKTLWESLKEIAVQGRLITLSDRKGK